MCLYSSKTNFFFPTLPPLCSLPGWMVDVGMGGLASPCTSFPPHFPSPSPSPTPPPAPLPLTPPREKLEKLASFLPCLYCLYQWCVKGSLHFTMSPCLCLPTLAKAHPVLAPPQPQPQQLSAASPSTSQIIKRNGRELLAHCLDKDGLETWWWGWFEPVTWHT